MRRLIAAVGAVVSVVAAGLGVAAESAHAEAADTCGSASTNRTQGVWLHDSIASSTDKDWFRFKTTSARHAFVELGGMSADLSLSVYNASCHLIVTADHTDDRFEQVYRLLKAGRYYVRVAGVGSANGGYDLRFRSLRNRVLVLSSRAYTDSIGDLLIPGEVLNNTGARREFVEVDVTFYNRTGRVIGTDFSFADLDIVRPWHRSPFEVIHQTPSGYDHYRLRVSSETTNAAPLSRLDLHRGVSYTDGIGDRIYPGEVHNGNTFRVDFTEVIGVLYGTHGNVRYTDFTFTNPDSIGVGGTAPYELDFGTVTGVNGTAFYVQAQRH
ncbi:MAG TPA: hypothetical protein VE441_01120 [Mycobacterium sp.]|nr:hypothetical protein [Mycobacterium sp.]